MKRLAQKPAGIGLRKLGEPFCRWKHIALAGADRGKSSIHDAALSGNPDLLSLLKSFGGGA